MTLTDYRTLGRSGLVVSPLSLGTMTFGTQRWGAGEDVSRAIFDAYVEAGGNFVDTADIYSGGRSEEMLGGFLADGKLRDRIVLATKAGFNAETGNPNAGGNGAKNINAALERSLRRLRTNYVDLFWVHVWDMVTPAEELLQTLGTLVREGKIRYFGLSNVPAWYAAKMATLAAAHGVPGPIALQFWYSLTQRDIEREHLPLAREFGMGVQPWSPLSGGFLTGKYNREEHQAGASAPKLPNAAATDDAAAPGPEGRLSGSNPFGDTLFTERNWRILDTLRIVAGEIGRSPAETALAWAVQQPGIASVLIGASRPEQIVSNVASLGLKFTSEQMQRLNTATEPEPANPYAILTPTVQRMVFGGTTVTGWSA